MSLGSTEIIISLLNFFLNRLNDLLQDPPKGICSVNKVEEEEDFLKDNSARLYEEIMSGVLTIEEEVRRWNENVAHRALLAELKLLG